MPRVYNVLRESQWPDHHRSGLEAALAAMRRHNRRRKRFNWGPEMRRGVRASWGRFLYWASRQSWYVPSMPFEALVTPDKVGAFVEHLIECDNALATIGHRLMGMERMTAALAPEIDRGWLSALRAEYPKAGDRREKRARIQLTDDLIRFAAKLANAADELAAVDPIAGAVLFQTAGQIMFLAYRAMRLKNFHLLCYGETVKHDGERWRLDIPAAATKKGNEYDPVLPDRLVELLGRFQAHRERLGGRPYEGRLWLFEGGEPQTARSINYHICTQTMKKFKRSMCPHLFRDAVMTTVATYMPERVRMGAPLVGNRDFTCTDEHYNQAERHIAQRKYDQALDDYEDAA